MKDIYLVCHILFDNCVFTQVFRKIVQQSTQITFCLKHKLKFNCANYRGSLSKDLTLLSLL